VTGAQQLAVVTVGTDHHRFDRLMEWLEAWREARPDAFRWIVQHGASRPMTGAEGFTIRPRDEVLELLRQAAVVVTQGGPGGIMDARESGRLPIVVPRLAKLDEVVDDHQVAFTDQLAGRGLVVPAHTREQLHAALDRALERPADFLATGETNDVPATVARLEAAVAALMARRPSRGRAPARRWHRLGNQASD